MQGKAGNSVVIICLIVFAMTVSALWIGNRSFEYNEGETYPVISKFNLDESFQVGSVAKVHGEVQGVYLRANGMLIYNIKSTDGLKISVMLWPGLGELEKVNQGDELEVTGTLGKYKENLQIEPLSKESIVILKKGDQESSTDVVKLGQVRDHLGKFITIGPVKVQNVKTFTSNAGKTHLKFQVYQSNYVTDALMWEGNWTKEDEQQAKSGKEFYIRAKVSEFNNRISLEIERLEVK